MRKTMRYAVVLFLLVGFLVILTPDLPVKAQSVYPGIYPGESFTYGTPNGTPWVWMDPSSAPPMPQWEPFVNMSTITFNITTNWEGNLAPNSEVMFNETFKYRNGTTITWPGQTIDVSTGEGAGASWFIAAGLGAGENIYPGNSSSQTINETTVNNTFWPDRNVCVMNYTVSVPLENASSEMASERIVFIWDESTGVLLAGFEEAATYAPTVGGGVEGDVLYELIANTVNIPMQYPMPANMTPIYIIIAFSIVAIIGVVIVRTVTKGPKKKHKRLKE